MAEISTGVATDSVAVDIEGFDDIVTQQTNISDDDGEEAHVAFRREDLNPDWVSSFKKSSLVEPTILKASSASKLCSIHRVPHSLRNHNENAYDPQLISIGPFHYKNREGPLQAMEEHKWRYLNDIISRKPEGWLESCLVTVKRLEEKARKYYSELITLDSNSFVKMMVLDGCFVVELFRRDWTKENNDVIFRLRWILKALYFDLILVENQIPFFILQKLSVLIDASDEYPPLADIALHYFFGAYYLSAGERIKHSGVRIRHLLHLVHSSYVLFHRKYTKPDKTPRIHCASKLTEEGIRFRKRADKRIDFLDIKFDEDGVIEIPTTKVWGKTKIEFLNLIAFEQCYPHCKRYVTAYAFLMDCLVNTAKDVEILCEEGIILDRLGDGKLIASHFHSLTREAIIYPNHFYLSGVCEKINKYGERAWPKLRASLVHDYLKNPWAIISFFAALFLLLFTMTQTFFDAFPKFAHGK